MRGNLVGAAMGVVAAAAVLTACGGGSSGGGAAGDPPGTDASSSDDSSAQTVTVSATEYELALSTTTFSPGTYRFRMVDDGHATHSIEIDGPGGSNQKSETAGPGGTAELTVTLQKGTYQMWCPVGNHRALGMQTTLTVG
jgi:uncharacterized cupredoxin-like copper-binding protein